MTQLKTPGVFTVEKNAFPNSVVEVATAVPAFVGWTERAECEGRSLHLKPWRIGSMGEYLQCFGGAPTSQHVRFELTREANAASPGNPGEALSLRDATPLSLGTGRYMLTQTGGKYLLHSAMQLFFANGGADCYVVSAGEYGSAVDAAPLTAGVQALTHEAEPTMLVIPEAVLLAQKDCHALQAQMLRHCGELMKNRVAILDVWEGYRSCSEAPDVVAAFGDGLGHSGIAFGAAYYPWVHTTVVPEGDFSHENIAAGESRDALITALKDEIAAASALLPMDAGRRAALEAEVEKIKTTTDPAANALLSKSLVNISPAFKALRAEMARRLNLLPPAAAMAGVYTMVDHARGVWQAPANVSLNGVLSPSVEISHEQQQALNLTPQGNSVNAIRSFVGEGVLVWGARTLDGNHLDWRYIHVRRTMIMLQESIRLAIKAMAFGPNVPKTWDLMKTMIASFLTGVWKRGGLAGAVPQDAFSVRVGLHETMTPEDLLEGVLRVAVLVAISRPVEFIEITFEQPMQKS
jgi:phage tail sheath protein FI